MARFKRFAHWLTRRRDGCRLLAGLSVAVLALLYSIAAQGGTGLPPTGEELHVNFWEWNDHAPPVGWFIVDFLIFILILVKFGKKPLQNTFVKRHETIKRSIEEATTRFERAEADHQDYQTKLANLDEETSKLIAIGKSDGEQERDRLVEEAEHYSNKMRTDSARLRENETVKARSRLQLGTVVKAFTAAEGLLKANINSSDQTRLLEEAITALEKDFSAELVVGGAQ